MRSTKKLRNIAVTSNSNSDRRGCDRDFAALHPQWKPNDFELVKTEPTNESEAHYLSNVKPEPVVATSSEDTKVNVHLTDSTVSDRPNSVWISTADGTVSKVIGKTVVKWRPNVPIKYVRIGSATGGESCSSSGRTIQGSPNSSGVLKRRLQNREQSTITSIRAEDLISSSPSYRQRKSSIVSRPLDELCPFLEEYKPDPFLAPLNSERNLSSSDPVVETQEQRCLELSSNARSSRPLAEELIYHKQSTPAPFLLTSSTPSTSAAKMPLPRICSKEPVQVKETFPVRRKISSGAQKPLTYTVTTKFGQTGAVLNLMPTGTFVTVTSTPQSRFQAAFRKTNTSCSTGQGASETVTRTPDTASTSNQLQQTALPVFRTSQSDSISSAHPKQNLMTSTINPSQTGSGLQKTKVYPTNMAAVFANKESEPTDASVASHDTDVYSIRQPLMKPRYQIPSNPRFTPVHCSMSQNQDKPLNSVAVVVQHLSEQGKKSISTLPQYHSQRIVSLTNESQYMNQLLSLKGYEEKTNPQGSLSLPLTRLLKLNYAAVRPYLRSAIAYVYQQKQPNGLEVRFNYLTLASSDGIVLLPYSMSVPAFCCCPRVDSDQISEKRSHTHDSPPTLDELSLLVNGLYGRLLTFLHCDICCAVFCDRASAEVHLTYCKSSLTEGDSSTRLFRLVTGEQLRVLLPKKEPRFLGPVGAYYCPFCHQFPLHGDKHIQSYCKAKPGRAWLNSGCALVTYQQCPSCHEKLTSNRHYVWHQRECGLLKDNCTEGLKSNQMACELPVVLLPETPMLETITTVEVFPQLTNRKKKSEEKYSMRAYSCEYCNQRFLTANKVIDHFNSCPYTVSGVLAVSFCCVKCQLVVSSSTQGTLKGHDCACLRKTFLCAYHPKTIQLGSKKKVAAHNCYQNTSCVYCWKPLLRLQLSSHLDGCLVLKEPRLCPASSCTNSELMEPDALASHLDKNHPGEVHFHCEKCPDRFVYLTELRHHVAMKHPPEPTKMSDVDVDSEDDNSDNEEDSIRLMWKQRQCSHQSCGIYFEDSHSLSRHYRSTHSRAINRSAEADCVQKNSGMQLSFSKVASERVCPVSSCDFSCKTSEEFEAHLANHHKTKPRCQFCDGKPLFDSYLILEEHQRLNHTREVGLPVSLFSCPFCNKVFESTLEAEKHKEVFHRRKLQRFRSAKLLSELKVRCFFKKRMPRCAKNSVKSRLLQFTCKSCGYICIGIKEIRAHLLLEHPNSDNYRCQLCSKTYLHPLQLAMHYALVHHPVFRGHRVSFRKINPKNWFSLHPRKKLCKKKFKKGKSYDALGREKVLRYTCPLEAGSVNTGKATRTPRAIAKLAKAGSRKVPRPKLSDLQHKTNNPCGLRFYSLSELEEHAKVDHGKMRLYWCQRCGISQLTVQQLNKHRFDLHGIKNTEKWKKAASASQLVAKGQYYW